MSDNMFNWKKDIPGDFLEDIDMDDDIDDDIDPYALNLNDANPRPPKNDAPPKPPVAVNNPETPITFEDIGGLNEQILSLKEMVLFPNLYPDIFSKLCIKPPTGVLFHGPPGTGKTLLARALANESSTDTKKFNFIARNATEFHNSLVGTSERMLRDLFNTANIRKPCIIFLDEIDGLIAARNQINIQYYTSVVCTLLSLMDGIKKNDEVIVIGATNRIDSIDPAFRRPGRFDRELYFPLPDAQGREEILRVHSKNISQGLNIKRIVDVTAGYSGADLRALCVEATFCAMKRICPSIYTSKDAVIDVNDVNVELRDYQNALKQCKCFSKKTTLTNPREIPEFLEPLMSDALSEILDKIENRNQNRNLQKLLLTGDKTQILHIQNALLNNLKNRNITSLTAESFWNKPGNPTEKIISTFRDINANKSSVFWLGDMSIIFKNDSLKDMLDSFLCNLDPELNVIVLAAVTTESNIPSIFSKYRREIYKINEPTKEQKRSFYNKLFSKAYTLPKISRKRDASGNLIIPNPSLIIDENGMNEILEKIVEKSGSQTENLIDLYIEIEKIILSYNETYDRSGLIHDLNNELDRFICQVPI